MKQFDLAEYLKNPDKKVVTRNGRSVRIVCTNRLTDDYQVVALVRNGDGLEDLFSYTKSGELYTYQNDDLDLFFAGVKKEGWINLYKINSNSTTSTGKVYNTEKEAKSSVVDTFIYISTIKIEWEE